MRSLEGNAKKGNIDSNFQLYENYSVGKFVDKNTEKANFYKEETIKLLKDTHLKIDSITLLNFRGFKRKLIKFNQDKNSNITVLIGNNGAGKTTILDAIAKNLSWLILRITSASASGKGDVIDYPEINNTTTDDYASISAKLSLSKNNHYTSELFRPKKISEISRKNQISELTTLADIYKMANTNNADFGLPTLAFYSVQRSYDVSKKDISDIQEDIFDNPTSKSKAYGKSLNGKADFDLFFNWFKYLSDKSNTDKNSDILNKIRELETELNSDAITQLKNISKTNKDIGFDLEKFISDKEINLKELKNNYSINKNNKSSEYIALINKTISKFMPGFSNLRIEYSPELDMKIDKLSSTTSVLQLSQGEKSLMALIADITRRLVLLNPNIKNALHGNGIILIDELELHLHPSWQQKIIPSLKNTFPNIQFIITTHSPQILTTCTAKEIVILDSSGNESVDFSPYGQSTSSALSLMNTNSTPQLSINDAINRYEQLVREGKIDSYEAQLALERLNNEGYEIPEAKLSLWKFLANNKDK